MLRPKGLRIDVPQEYRIAMTVARAHGISQITRMRHPSSMVSVDGRQYDSDTDTALRTHTIWRRCDVARDLAECQWQPMGRQVSHITHNYVPCLAERRPREPACGTQSAPPPAARCGRRARARIPLLPDRRDRAERSSHVSCVRSV